MQRTRGGARSAVADEEPHGRAQAVHGRAEQAAAEVGLPPRCASAQSGAEGPQWTVVIGCHKRQTPPAGPCTTARPRGVDHTVRHTDRPAPEGGRRRDLAGSQSDDRPAFPGFRSDAHPLAKVDVEGSNPFSRSRKRVEFDAITALFTAFVRDLHTPQDVRTPPLRSRLSLIAGQLSSAVFRGGITGASSPVAA